MDLDTLRVDAKALHPGLGADGAVHALDPEDGLDLTEMSILVVINPDLKARRTRLEAPRGAGLVPCPKPN